MKKKKPWRSKSPNGKEGYIRLFTVVDRQSPKASAGEDGCHSRQWVALFIMQITILKPHVCIFDRKMKVDD